MKNLLQKIKASDNSVIVLSIVIGAIASKLLGLALPEDSINSIAAFIVDVL